MKSKKKVQCKVKISNRPTQFGVDIPEKDLMDLLQLDCSKEIDRVGKEVFSKVKTIKWENGKVLDFSKPDMRKVCKAATTILNLIQVSWRAVLKEYAKSTELPKGFVPDGYKAAKPKPSKKEKAVCCAIRNAEQLLSKDEKGKIRALRKTGLSIKAIGKEIHRAEKVVRDFCKALPL